LTLGLPDFSYERELWQKGFRFLVGLDEVGRGAFAGPVMVGGVIFAGEKVAGLEGLNDSKLLRPRFRERLAKRIKSRALAWGVASVGVKAINQVGIGRATQMAMRKLVLGFRKKNIFPDFALSDAFYIPRLRGLPRQRQRPIVKGDQKSFSIAAASILAKVERDRLMRRLGREPCYRRYDWGKNKGYGTLKHRQAILKFGASSFHRRVFIQKYLSEARAL
jgi:ribonuclease HII